MNKTTIIENILCRFGFERLTPMQTAVADSSADSLILIAPTGSGKTVAFAIYTLSRLEAPGRGVQAVIIAPSRELVLQICGVIRPVARGYKTVALYGGHAVADETASLSVTPDIIIATPGRLLDHIVRSNTDLSGVSSFVIDEYDKALELGFADEMKKCVRAMPSVRYRILTSATELRERPAWLDLSRAETVVAGSAAGPKGKLQTVHVESPLRDKLSALADLLRSLDNDGGRVIVFVNHRESAERVWRYLRDEGFPAGLYHGGLDQQQREQAIDLLDNGSTPILVATDLGARGLDIEGIGAVIHYHMPLSTESMTHRNGRTARMGASGTVYYLTSEGDDIPEYVVWDRDYYPSGPSANPLRPHNATLYFKAGKKEKISRGDIAGYLIANAGLTPGEIGKIIVKDHSALAAVPASRADEVVGAVASAPLKGKKVKVSLLSGGEEPKAAKPILPRRSGPASPSAPRRGGGRTSSGAASDRKGRKDASSEPKDRRKSAARDWREIVRRMDDRPAPRRTRRP